MLPHRFRALLSIFLSFELRQTTENRAKKWHYQPGGASSSKAIRLQTSIHPFAANQPANQ